MQIRKFETISNMKLRQKALNPSSQYFDQAYVSLMDEGLQNYALNM